MLIHVKKIWLSTLLGTLALGAASCRSTGEVSETASVNGRTGHGAAAKDESAPIPLVQMKFYELNHVHEIEIKADQWSDLAKQQPKGGHCNFNFMGKRYDWFHFTSITIDGTTFNDVGAKKKSWCGSESNDKPSMNIDLSKYQKDNKTTALQTLGTEKLILNNSEQDLSYVRQCFAYRFFERIGVASLLCDFSHVVVNGKDMGIYVNLQPLSDGYYKAHFGNQLGNVYEIARENFVPSDREHYKDALDSLKKPADESLDDIQAVVRVLNAPTLDMEKLSALVDIPYFINFWAAEMILTEWDGLTHGNNNTYLYFPAKGKMRVIPWGADQILKKHKDTVTKETYIKNLLAKRLSEKSEYKKQLKARINEILALYWNEDNLKREAKGIGKLVSPYLSLGDRIKQRVWLTEMEVMIMLRKKELDYTMPDPFPITPLPIAYPLVDANWAPVDVPLPTPSPEGDVHSVPISSALEQTYCLAAGEPSSFQYCPTVQNQKWSIVKTQDGSYTIKSKTLDRCLKNPSAEENMAIELDACGDSSANTWTYYAVHGGKGRSQFESRSHPGICLAMQKDDGTKPRNLITKHCDSEDLFQLFDFAPGA